MNSVSAYRFRFLTLAIPLSIAVIAVLIKALSPVLTDELAFGIIYDLTLTSPLLYLLVIWKKRIPKITAVPVFVLGVIVASFLIPEDQQFHLDIVKNFVLPIVELTVITLIVVKIRQAIQLYKKRDITTDFYTQFQSTANDLLENKTLANVLTTEVSMIYYGLINWKREKPKANAFTYHKESGTLALLGAVILILLVETIGLHFLLIQWNAIVAWVIFGLSLYTALQVLGHAKAMKRRFVEITKGQLILRYGLFGDGIVPLDTIESIELTSKDLPEDHQQEVVRLAMLGELEGYNTILYLKEPITITGAYGLKKTGTILLLHVDEKERFLLEVQS